MSDNPKLINGKVWVPLNGGYCPLSPDDPKYNEILLWILLQVENNSESLG